jgi:hypothetical protein
MRLPAWPELRCRRIRFRPSETPEAFAKAEVINNLLGMWQPTRGSK